MSADLLAVLTSWEAASKLAHPFLDDAFLAQERTNIAELYLPKAETWVAEVDGDVVGFISLLGNEIGGLFLNPKEHGKGIGRALVGKAQELYPTLEVEVFAQNSIGRRFYERYGLVELYVKAHNPTGEQALRLRFKSVDMET